MQGQVLEVSITPAGDELASPHAAGATTLLLMSTDEFLTGTGGFVQVEGIVYEFDTVNTTANSIHLLTGLATDAEEGEKVYTLPLSEEKWAMVEVKDFDEPISARVAHGLKDKMVDGVRDPEDQETVVVEMQDGDWTVVDLIQEIPSIDGAYLTPDTVPLPPTSDGNPPPSSPAPEVIDGIGAFYLRWTPPVNADPMTFEVHVSDVSGFIPSPTTKYTETGSYSATVRNLPWQDQGTGQWVKFTYDQPYFFKIVAKDEDNSAAASAESSGTLRQITGDDVRVKSLRGENIIGETLTGDLFSGTVVLGSTISTGALDENRNIVGARVDLGPLGIHNYDAAGNIVVQFPTSADDDAFVRAHFEMLSADVRDNFSMFGLNNQLAKGSKLTLSQGTIAPTAPPTVSYAYDTVRFDTNTAKPPHSASNGYNLGTFALNASQITSIAWDSTWSCWVVIQQKTGGFRVWRFTSTGAIYNNIATGRAWVDDYQDRSQASCAFGSGTGNQNGLATLFKSGPDWYIWGPQINKIPASWILDAAADTDKPPALGYDAVNHQWMIVQNNGGANGTMHVRRFTLVNYSGSGAFPNASAQSSVAMEAGSGNSRRFNGIVYGQQVVTGSNRYAVSQDEWYTVEVYNTSGTKMDDEGTYEQWPKSSPALGFTHNGVQFASVDATGLLTLYTDWNWPQVSTTAWIGASAYDSDPAGDPASPHVGQTAGTHETPVGSMLSFSQRRRAKLVITMPETPDAGGPDDPDLWRLYYARQAPTPAKANLKYIDQIGSPTARTSKTIFSDPTGGQPAGGVQGQVGAVNNFPGGTPARIVSTGLDGAGNPVIDLQGDGSGRVGPVAWTKTGADANDTGWVNMTLLNGASNYGSPYVGGQYRKVGKMVYLRGLVNVPTVYSNPLTNLPVGFRPVGGDVIFAQLSQTKTQAVTGDGTKTTSGPDDNVTTSTQTHTHNMKNHTHTVSLTLTASASNMATRVDVKADGNVACVGDPGGWVSLTGISFLID